ncbi:MAG: 50S ribosomal protein L1 [Anaerolineae bacterium]|nr:50S ribosomal protein L1 [Anaerolineae bacterium]
MSSRGRKYLEAAAKVDGRRAYGVTEALQLVKDTSFTKFDGTVEVHMRLGVDPRHADQQVRGTVVLPHGTGKEVRVLVFAEGEAQRIAEEAGADYVGGDDLVERIQGGWLDFDLAIAVPQMMGKVGRLGRILGPRGLMPNPRVGTVVQPEDLVRVVSEAKRGRVEFRVDRGANLHVAIGNTSFEVEKLRENFAALMAEVIRSRPPAARGQFIRRITVTSTMGPGVKVDVAEAQALV